ncbi:MAG: two-component hybrid sensor and regulator [Myxococcaceae bacterium]|nr:two-component hybrid sensor and regulator [Myxococcaceae bacterium]
MSVEDEEKLLRSAALQNVQTILHARQRAEQQLLETKEALEEETRILELLNKTGAMLTSKLDLTALVQAVTDAGTELSGAQFGAFFYTVSNPEGDVFSLYTLSGAPREAFEKFGHPRATPIFAPTFRGECVIRIADVLADPRYGKMGPHHGMPPGHLPVRSYLAVPVKTQSGEVVGGLFFGHAQPDVFSERSERLIVGIAAQAAISIDNARLYEAAKKSAEDRSTLLDAERAARAEIERVSLIKDEFLATLSHELRTPLNAVLGWSEILLARAEESSDLHRGLQTIARNARAQTQLIEDLLDMNRIVSGRIRLDVQQIDLAPIVEAVLESLRPSADAKSITFRKTVDPSAGTMIADPNRVQQIMWNLLNNAVKFTPKGGNVDVTVQRVDSNVEVSVQDSGIGIGPSFLPYLFERFRQADSSTTRKYGGLGLGLSIVKQLVELHGGSVTAESQGEGRGATFMVTLPLRPARDRGASARENAASARSPLHRPPPVSLVGIRVLVIDDEPDARDLVMSVLVDAGAEVITASSAVAGLALVRSEHPDVIVSDIGMPDRDGYDFIRDVRGLSPSEGGRTPSVALTAFARSEDRTRAMLAGYHVHVSKPIEPQELVATVRSLTRNSVIKGGDGAG